MSGRRSMEACRSHDELRAAYADAMAKQVAAAPEDLAVLRTRFRRRRHELERGLGSAIEGRAAWILACLESSLPDEILEAELLRLSADDPGLDLGRLRQVLAAREAWRDARADPSVPPIVLRVLAGRLGVPPRGKATAQDVAHPRQVAEHVREAYPQLHALDRKLFYRIAGMPAQPSRRSGEAAAVPEKKLGKRGVWLTFLAMWLVAKVIGLAFKSPDPPPTADIGTELSQLGSTDLLLPSAEEERLLRWIAELEALEKEIRRATAEAHESGRIDLPRHQRLREHIEAVRYGVKELVFAKARLAGSPDYPTLDDLAELSVACERASGRLEIERLQAMVERTKARLAREQDDR